MGGAHEKGAPLIFFLGLSISDGFFDSEMEGFDLRDQTPLYHHTDSYAQEHGELDRYHASYQANIACKEAIEQAIADSYRDNRLNIACVDQVLEHFGYERMLYVLANTVRQKEQDGRISHDNRAWARTVPVTPAPDGLGGDRNRYFIVDKCNTGLMDLFLTQARKAYALGQEKRPSVRESLNKNAGQQAGTDRAEHKKAQER